MPIEPAGTTGNIINSVKKFVHMPCAPTPLVYLELAAQAALKAWWTIEAPDIRSAITELTGRSGLCHVKGILNNAHELSGLPETHFSKVLYPVAETADLLTWYLFLAGVVGNGIADFFSGAAKLGSCKNPPAHFGYGNTTAGGWPGGQYDGKWQTGPRWQTIDWPTTPGAGPIQLVRAHHKGVITGTCKIGITGAPPGQTIPFNLRTRWNDDPHNIITQSDAEFSAKDLGFQTTIYSEVLNSSDQDRVLLLEIQFPGGVPGPSCLPAAGGYGYSYG